MLRRVKLVAIAAVAMVAMSASAMAATIIDFRDGSAGVSGSVSYNGTDVVGSNILIGNVNVFDSPNYANENFDVTGSIGGFGVLNFNTATDTITISGCVAELNVGTSNLAGDCTGPVNLLTGSIGSFTVIPNTGAGGAVFFSGIDTKNADLLRAIGLDPNTTFALFGFDLTTTVLNPNGPPALSTSVDIQNTAVPEPATMMLLGTGLLAAFRARKRQA